MTCTQQAAKEGPTISFDPILGALVAHVTDRSGVTSQCEHKSDFYTRKAVVRISVRNRSAPNAAPRSGCSTLIATSRSCLTSCARYTVAMTP